MRALERKITRLNRLLFLNEQASALQAWNKVKHEISIITGGMDEIQTSIGMWTCYE